jgi:hypothetical protein
MFGMDCFDREGSDPQLVSSPQFVDLRPSHPCDDPSKTDRNDERRPTGDCS